MKFPKFLRVLVYGSKEIIRVNSTYTTTRDIIDDERSVEFTKIFAHALGFSYELVVPRGRGGGSRLPNGTWTGVVGMLQSREADIGLLDLTYSADRAEVVLFASPHHRSGITFATRKPEYSPDPGAFLRPFNPEVWWFSIAWFVVMPFVFSVLMQGKYSLRKTTWAVYSSIVGQDFNLQPRKTGDYLLIIFWILGIMFLSFSYTAVLLSFLSFPPMKGIRTIPALAAAVTKGKYQCTSYQGGVFGSELARSSKPDFKVIGRNVMSNKANSNVEAVLNKTKSKTRQAFVGEEGHLTSYAAYFVSEDQFFPIFFSIPMRKDFCCKSAIDRVVGYIWASGLYRKLSGDEKFLRSVKKFIHSPDILDKNQERPLTVEEFLGPFFLLGTGYVSATVIFVCELLIGKYRKKVCKKVIRKKVCRSKKKFYRATLKSKKRFKKKILS